MTNLGASMGTALAGSLMIAAVASSFVTNIQASPTIPAEAKSQAQIELAGGVAFVSDADLEAALDEAGVAPETTEPHSTLTKELGSTASARTRDPGRARADRPLLHQRIPSTQPGARPRLTGERGSPRRSLTAGESPRAASRPPRYHRGASPERVMRRRRDSEIVRLPGRLRRSPRKDCGSKDEATAVLVADDHPLMLAAVRRLLEESPDFEIVGEVSVGSHVLPAVNETHPDVVLLDVRMPELDGITCLQRLRKQDPDIAVVILSSYSDDEQIEAARVAGARGYVVKTVAPVDLPTVIRSALQDDAFRVWGTPVPTQPESAAAPLLSERETAVLEAVARGLSNREIGQQLWISEQTVKFHLRNVYRKLGVSSRTEAARYAYRSGLASSLTVESA